MKEKKQKVIVAMSGGVDSTAAAFLLQKKGFEVMGVFMRLGDDYQESENAVRRVCDRLGINFYPINLSERFNDEIVEYFVNAYASGDTPNPCVKCNKLIKFGELLKWKDKLGADYLATGHYIKNIFNSDTGEHEIYKADDKSKDQSYFLYNLKQADLKQIIFPLSEWIKEDVKKLISDKKLPTLQKESMDICFLSKNGKAISQNDYLLDRLTLEPGPIIWLKEGEKREELVVGEHKGLPLYTIGQRRGVDVGGTGPYYVSSMDYQKNVLYVVKDPMDELLLTKSASTKNNSFISDKQRSKFQCQAVIRYGHEGVDSRVEVLEDGIMQTTFKTAQRAVTPGQSLVWYDGERLLGGGVIVNL